MHPIESNYRAQIIQADRLREAMNAAAMRPDRSPGRATARLPKFRPVHPVRRIHRTVWRGSVLQAHSNT